MSNALEDRLVSTLLSRYQVSGENAQKLLDNSLFVNLPLDQKLRYIQKYKEYLSSPIQVTPKKLSPLLMGSVMGGIAGASALYANNMMMGGKSFSPSYLAAAAGVGALLGTVTPGAMLIKNHFRDKQTQQDVSENKYLSALINRSVTSPAKPKDINWNVYTDMVTGPTHKFLTDVNNYDPSGKATPLPEGIEIPIHPDALK